MSLSSNCSSLCCEQFGRDLFCDERLWDKNKCKLYLAESTIPDSGLGIFTAIDLPDEAAVGYPEIVIPLIDINWHNDGSFEEGDYYFLWRDYIWDPGQSFGGMEHEAATVDVIAPGFGAAANYHPKLVNTEQTHPVYSSAGLHRSRDPGAGAFSGYHGRTSETVGDVPAGGELFVDYGGHYFFNRSDHSDDKKVCTQEETVAQHTRPLEWLEQKGKCMDNIFPSDSNISQAGRGAFAARYIPEGSLVAPAPLIHMPNRDILNMYGRMTDTDGNSVRDVNNVISQQLLLNYCFGHQNSTVLLCPYGATTPFINHDGKRPNTRIQWADASSSSHNPDWLMESVDELKTKNRAGIAFDFVATRDIYPGEEVLIDYGEQWEKAWNMHVSKWSPPANSESYTYTSAALLNKDVRSFIRTQREQETNPYPRNLQIVCHYLPKKIGVEGLSSTRRWTSYDKSSRSYPCEIVSREDDGGKIVYSARIIVDEDLREAEDKQPILTHIPRWGISFRDKMYTRDEHLPNVFRHEIMIPDDMFPKAWLNK